MARAAQLNEASPTYCGVLAEGNGVRLIMSARGACYALQERDGNGWARFQSCPTRSALAAHVWAVLHDPARSIREAAERLPDDPRECERGPLKPRLRCAS